MDSIKIKIAKDFATAPGPRYIKEGEWSGELFRTTILYPNFLEAIKSNLKLVVDLDGTAGYGTSFLEESFGGLIREEGLNYDTIKKHLEIISKEETYLIEDINNYLLDASKEGKNAK